MAALFNVVHHGVGIGVAPLLLLWLTPQVLSTVQLFWFGTYLPHRAGAFEGDGPTRTRSVDLPRWASFLTCFHFGYHFEHHARPDLPWWRLPAARRDRPRAG